MTFQQQLRYLLKQTLNPDQFPTALVAKEIIQLQLQPLFSSQIRLRLVRYHQSLCLGNITRDYYKDLVIPINFRLIKMQNHQLQNQRMLLNRQ